MHEAVLQLCNPEELKDKVIYGGSALPKSIDIIRETRLYCIDNKESENIV